MFSYVRFIYATEDELSELAAEHEGLPLDEIGPLSIRNEQNVLYRIREAAKVALNGFEDSLEDDNWLLREGVVAAAAAETGAVVDGLDESLSLVTPAAAAASSGTSSGLRQPPRGRQPTLDLSDSNVRNCIVMRRGEKEILHWYIKLADTCIPMLELSYGSLQRQCGHHVENVTALDEYVMVVVFPLVRLHG